MSRTASRTRKPRTRRERVEAREGAIIAAARELFAARDFDDVPVGEIAEQAGVAEGTVYLYFESKAALLHAVVVAFYEELTERAAAGVRTIRDTRKRLEFLAEHHVESVIAHRRILFGVDRRGTDEADDQYRLNRAYVAVFDDVVREGVDRGDVREDVPLWLLRDMFYGSLEYAARTTMIHARIKDARVATRSFLDAFAQGVLVTGGSRAVRSDAAIESVALRLERVVSRLEGSVSGRRRS